MNISIWSITYQHYDEKINQSLKTCIILGGGIFSKFSGELAKRGELKNSGGFGPWMKLYDRGFNFWGFNFGGGGGLRGLN